MRAIPCAVLAVLLLCGGAAAQPSADLATCTGFEVPDTVALEACNRAIAAGGAPTDIAAAYLNRGQISGRAGEYVAAIAEYDAGLALLPDRSAAVELAGQLLDFRGYAFYRLDRDEEAIVDWQAAIALGYDYGFIRYQLASAYYALRRRDEARAQLDIVLARDPDYSSALYLRGWVFMAGRLHEAALADFARLVELHPLDGDYLESLGMAYHRLDNNAEAIRAFGSAILVDPNLGDARFILEERTPPREAPNLGPLVYRPPPAGLTIRNIEVIGESLPVIDPMEAAIRDLIGFFSGGPEYPVPEEIGAFERSFGATESVLTPVTETPLYDRSLTAFTVPYFMGIWPMGVPPGGPALTVEHDAGATAFWSMAPGDTVSGTARFMFPCPPAPNAFFLLLGCRPGLAAAPVGTITWTAKFEGWEYVVVPAGQRLAAKVSFVDDRAIRLAGPALPAVETHIVGAWWIDPELGFWIKRQQSQNGQTQTIEAVRIDLP